jgi:hypothetical protein
MARIWKLDYMDVVLAEVLGRAMTVSFLLVRILTRAGRLRSWFWWFPDTKVSSF